MSCFETMDRTGPAKPIYGQPFGCPQLGDTPSACPQSLGQLASRAVHTVHSHHDDNTKIRQRQLQKVEFQTCPNQGSNMQTDG